MDSWAVSRGIVFLQIPNMAKGSLVFGNYLILPEKLTHYVRHGARRGRASGENVTAGRNRVYSGKFNQVHGEVKVVPENEITEESCLHCEINDVVREYIEGQTTVNIAELVGKMSESLVELIMLGPEEEWGNLLAEAMRQIGHSFLEKSGAAESDTTH
jgi:hypothetical protein